MATGSVIFKYSKGEYEAKITTLEGYVSNLETLLSDFETKKSQISTFWDDDKAVEFTNIINTNIRNCRSSINRTNVTISQLKGTVKQMEGGDAAVGQLWDDAREVVEIYKDVTDSSAATIAQGLIDDI